jgi:hypothetical protein
MIRKKISRNLYQLLKKSHELNLRNNRQKYEYQRVDAIPLYENWLQTLEFCASLTIREPHEQEREAYIALILFPLIDAVAKAHKMTMRGYFKYLGISHPDLLCKAFRNGQMHNMRNVRLMFSDGNVHWGMGNQAGTSGIHAFDEGYLSDDPTLNRPPEIVLSYLRDTNNMYWVTLELDRLVAMVKSDLQKRRASSTDMDSLRIVVGAYIYETRPPAELEGEL